MLQLGFHALSWTPTDRLLALAEYEPEYEVRRVLPPSHLQILQSVGIVFILCFLSLVPTLPLSFYQTSVFGEKHGFNKTTLSLFVVDLLKS